MLHRFEIHSSLKLSPTALLCYRLFARLLVGNKSRKLAQEQKRGMKLGKREKFFLLSRPPPPSIFQFLLLSPQLPSLRRTGVTAFWASPRFGHPHSHIPSVLGIPFSYYCSVLGIPRYPPGMPKSLAFWASPPKQFGISRENRKPFRDGFR